MSFSSLHAIEQQLILQFCDCNAFHSFARCSRSILAVAACEFSCRFLSPARVCLEADVASLVSRSLLRFCDIDLCMDLEWSPYQSQWLQKWSMVRAACASVPRLRSFRFSADVMPDRVEEWSELFALPNLSALTSMELHAEQVDAMESIAAHLTRLRTLRVHGNCVLSNRAAQWLCKVPSLTEIDTVCFLSCRSSSALRHLTNCASLRKLVLREWQGEVVNALLTTDRFRNQIEELTLWGFSLHGQIQNLHWWTTLFAGLTHLRRLTLHCYNDLSTLVEGAVTKCPTLELLTVRVDLRQGWLLYWQRLGTGTLPSDDTGDMTYDDMVVSPSSLANILQHRSQMHKAASPAESGQSDVVAPLLIQLCFPATAQVACLLHPNRPQLTLADWNERVRTPFAQLSSQSTVGVRFELVAGSWFDDADV